MDDQKVNGKTPADNVDGEVFDFDAFEDMLSEEELSHAIQQHQSQQAQIQQQEQQEQEALQKDIDELCTFRGTYTESSDDQDQQTVVEDAAPPAHVARANNVAGDDNCLPMPTMVEFIAPPSPPSELPPSSAESALVPELVREQQVGGAIDQVEGQADDQQSDSNKAAVDSTDSDSHDNLGANSGIDNADASNDDSDELRLESFLSPDDTVASKVVANEVDVESLSARHLAQTIHDESLYTISAVKYLAQHRHLRAAIRKVRLKLEVNIDFDRLARLVDEKESPSRDDQYHLRAYELLLQKLLLNVFDYMYVVGKAGDSIEQLIAVEYEDFFETMTGLTRQDFAQLCKLGVFNAKELMQTITAFNLWSSKTMNAENFILYHINASQQAGVS
ncbi:MAG: hypothetical protein OYH77_00020 [Pseudomonadota bacterium]|nr:hypothetical protein [Pseudomonadota bacterium]